MSNAAVEGLFLLAFWAPPLTVVLGALLLVTIPSFKTSPLMARTAAAHR